MHYTLIISPKGQALLSLLESAHKLVPYAIIRQTLKIGNVATMISGMVKIVLAKASIATVTNWLGLSKGADEGQNLVQTIMFCSNDWDVGLINSVSFPRFWDGTTTSLRSGSHKSSIQSKV